MTVKWALLTGGAFVCTLKTLSTTSLIYRNNDRQTDEFLCSRSSLTHSPMDGVILPAKLVEPGAVLQVSLVSLLVTETSATLLFLCPRRHLVVSQSSPARYQRNRRRLFIANLQVASQRCSCTQQDYHTRI